MRPLIPAGEVSPEDSHVPLCLTAIGTFSEHGAGSCVLHWGNEDEADLGLPFWRVPTPFLGININENQTDGHVFVGPLK